jgi:hypothetical protein
MVASNASAHAAPVYRSLLMLFVLLTIVVVIAAHGVLLYLLLLLHLIVNFRFKVFGFCFKICLLLLLASALLLLTLVLNKLFGVLVKVELQVVSFERFVTIRDELTVFFDLPDFIEVAF